MKETILFWEVFFVISSVPTRNYLSKFSNWSTRIRCENCPRLRMKALERCQWRGSNVYIIICKHISNFLLIIDFEQANTFLVHIEKTNIFEGKIRYTRFINSYVVVIYVGPKVINKLKLYYDNPTGESVRNFCEGVYFKRWFWLKRCHSHSK